MSVPAAQARQSRTSLCSLSRNSSSTAPANVLGARPRPAAHHVAPGSVRSCNAVSPMASQLPSGARTTRARAQSSSYDARGDDSWDALGSAITRRTAAWSAASLQAQRTSRARAQPAQLRQRSSDLVPSGMQRSRSGRASTVGATAASQRHTGAVVAAQVCE